MILFSIGLPSRFAEWCDAVLFRLMERAAGSVEAAPVNTLEELATASIRVRAHNILACCRQPVLRLQTELAQAGRPFLLALGDPRAALRELVEDQAHDIVTATRVLASSCASLLSLAKAEGALVLSGGDMGDPAATIAAISRHFALGLAAADIAAVIAELSEFRPGGGRDDEEAAWARLSEREQAIVRGALVPYLAHFSGGDLAPMVWEPELFYISEHPPAPNPVPAGRPVDLTGRVRFVVYGPFINLPPGAWSATIVLGFSAEAAGLGFIVEIFAGAQLAQSRIEPAGEQVIEVGLHFTIEDRVDQPVQIRIQNERAAFEGRLALGYAVMTRHAAVSQDRREALVNVLRQ